MQQVHISPKHKLVGVPDNAALAQQFPNAITLDFNGLMHRLVPHEPSETFMLRQLGYDVPAPILTNYAFPHPMGETPFNAQRITAALLTMNNRAYVLNGLGTGKTRSAIWAWDYLRSNNLAKKLLVFAPLSTLKFTWGHELFCLLPTVKYAVLHGSKQKRLDLLNSDAEVFIINHDGIAVIFDELIKHKKIDTVIIDELAVYRNGGTVRSKKMRALCQVGGKIKWAWGMTGSPTPREPTDVWGQAKIITPYTTTKYFNETRDMLMRKATIFKWEPKEDAVERAYTMLQPAVRFTLDDVYELPEVVHQTVQVDIGKEQARVYKALVQECYAAVQRQEITAINGAAVMTKLLQVSTGYVYTADGTTVSLDNDDRVDALLNAIESAERKVLVFVPFKHALKGVSEALTREKIEHEVVSGDTSANQRSEIFNLFQNTNKYKVLVAHPKCLAHGITLTAADTIIWFSPVTDLETYEQANARISRVGQKHKQLVLHLQGTPIEKKIYKLLQAKQKVQDSLLELFAEATQDISL